MRIGIITVLYKSSSVIEGFIESMNAQIYQNYDVFFVENEVENAFCEEFIQSNARFSFTFLRNEKNEGVGKGNNQGIDHYLVQTDITHLLFLNNDILVASDFLEQQVVLLEENEDVDALAPKMFYYGKEEKIWYAGGKLSYLKEGPIHFGHNKRDKLIESDLFPLTYAPTCSFIIRKDILERTGIRMWEQLFVYHDDYVFCKELYRAGVKLFYTPNIHLLHKISTSTGGTKSDFSRYYLTRNWAYTMRKYKNVLILLLPLILLFNLSRGARIENRAIIDSFKMP